MKPYISQHVLPGAETIETNSYLNAPVAEGKHPLLLYNHGFSMGLASSTVQFEELASHGYIILSIGHPGDGSYELPDGTVLLFDMEKMMQEYAEDAAAGSELFTKYWLWLTGEGKNTSIEAHRPYYRTLIERQPSMVAHIDVWIQDSLTALDLFLEAAGQAGTPFYNRVDPAKIGAFGMSYGGSIALSLAQASDRIKAAANLDGFFYSPHWEQPITKPMLALHHSDIGGYFLTFPFLNAEKEAYLVTIRGTTHGNFMDYNELLAENLSSKVVINGAEVEVAMLGKIDPELMETLLNRLLLDFFDKYLEGKASQFIDSAHLPDEVTLLRK